LYPFIVAPSRRMAESRICGHADMVAAPYELRLGNDRPVRRLREALIEPAAGSWSWWVRIAV
jgi:hypothetical protein